MEPRIRYAKTEDEVSIAYALLGAGKPLVVMPPPFSNLQLSGAIPEVRRWEERLAERWQIVRYDSRGTGLSDRDVTDFSLDALVLDLEAVVERLGLETFALFAPVFRGPVGITYATRHPQRVSHLILWCSYARAPTSPIWEATISLADKDYELFTETMAHVVYGWSAGEPARRAAAMMRESATQEATLRASAAQADVDVTELLPQVGSPTLVIHRRQVPSLGVDLAKDLASRIPDSRLAVLEGTTPDPTQGDTDSVLMVIEEFLAEGEKPAADAKELSADIVHTILFTDVEGSTALTQRLGDAKARDLLREHERNVREALKSHGGSEVKTMGDGFMASFSSATKALECAIAMQRAFAQHNESAAEPIVVRVGLNAGEPIAEDEDLFGTAVNEAARITAAAKGGEILVSNVVRELAKGKDFLFADRGETNLKGFDESVRLFEVRWRE